MEDETTVSDRKQLIHVSNPQRCPGDESDSDWWIHWSFKNWSIRSLHCDVTFSPPLCRNHRVKKPTQESDNTTFSGGEDNGDARSHLSHDSAPSHTPHPPGQTPSEAGPSRKRPRASDDGSGGEADSGSPTPPLRRHKEGPGSEIELVFRPHPQLVHGQDYNQTRWDRSHESNCYTDSNRDVPVSYFLLFLIKMFLLCRFVKTTANATVDHLSKYLALRIALEEGQTNGEAEDRGREEGGGEAEGRTGSGEGSGLNSISEKQYTIYILTRGGQFSVSVKTFTRQSL